MFLQRGFVLFVVDACFCFFLPRFCSSLPVFFFLQCLFFARRFVLCASAFCLFLFFLRVVLRVICSLTCVKFHVLRAQIEKCSQVLSVFIRC